MYIHDMKQKTLFFNKCLFPDAETIDPTDLKIAVQIGIDELDNNELNGSRTPLRTKKDLDRIARTVQSSTKAGYNLNNIFRSMVISDDSDVELTIEFFYDRALFILHKGKKIENITTGYLEKMHGKNSVRFFKIPFKKHLTSYGELKEDARPGSPRQGDKPNPDTLEDAEAKLAQAYENDNIKPDTELVKNDRG